jgi:polyisoprenoid-binding protein YceI
MNLGLAPSDMRAAKVAAARGMFFAGVVTALVLAACAPPVPPPASPLPETSARPEGFPEPYYRRAAEQKQRVFVVEPTRSSVVIEVRRGGSLSRLGHDHVVASHDVHGYAAPDSGRANLYVDVDRLVVDEPELRAQAGFDTEPSKDDISGTRRNMLAKVFDAGRFPFVLVSVNQPGVAAGSVALEVALTLHGVTRVYAVPVQIGMSDSEIEVSGKLALKQSDFGIEPLSILGGAIAVQDEISLRFDIRARRLAS